LTHYGFRKINNAPDKGGYWEPKFLRGEPELASSIRRVIRGAGRHKLLPTPDFYKDLPPQPINSIVGKESPNKNEPSDTSPSEEGTPAAMKPRAPGVETKNVRSTVTPGSVSTPALKDDAPSIDSFLLDMPKAMGRFNESMTVKQMAEGIKVNLHTIDSTIQCVDEMIRALSNVTGPDAALIDLVAADPNEGAELQEVKDSIDAEEASIHLGNPFEIASATKANNYGKVPEEVLVYDGKSSSAAAVQTGMAGTTSTAVMDFNGIVDFFDRNQDEFSQITFEGDTEVAEAKLRAETEAMFHQVDYVAAVGADPLPTDDAFEAEMICFFFDL
jgi:hypothetical protein